MLIKALLTGGMLSVLAGSIVYFGTEGAIADEPSEAVRVELDSTELAGGETTKTETIETIVQKTVEAKDPPKTKWLDQYLKADKSDTTVEAEDEVEVDVEMDPVSEAEKIEEDVSGNDTRADIIDMLKRNTKRSSADEKTVEDKADEGDMSGASPEPEIKNVRTDRRVEAKSETKSMPATRSSSMTDYARVLDEARKIDIVDIRDQALLEIIDHALDQGEVEEAADILTELSKPELRDTARSRMGVNLAQMGETDAAFAVLDEVEVEALAAPIRLDIIATLMATRAERANGMPLSEQ